MRISDWSSDVCSSDLSSIENGIGIMTVTRFDGDTGSQARATAQEFKSAGVIGVILDLRGNGGVYVTSVQDLASLRSEEPSVGEGGVSTCRPRWSPVP